MDYISRAEHEEFAKRMETEHKQQNKRIKSLEDDFKQFTDLTFSVHEIAISVKSMVEEQKRQGERLEKLENVPADNWQKLRDCTISATVGAIITIVASTLIK